MTHLPPVQVIHLLDRWILQMVQRRSALEARAGSFTISRAVSVGSRGSPAPGFELGMKRGLLVIICL